MSLRSDSMYGIEMGGEQDKSEFADAVDTAKYIYLCTMLLSLLFWIRTYTAAGLRGSGNTR